MRQGFSLVELSIVLVILGLLTGGILTGQSLIRAAELRSVTTEFKNYQTAVMTFRDKYFALPGDMANATDFWGAMDADFTTCAALNSTSPSTDTLTCNGNNDGYVSGSVGSISSGYETFRFWQHLSNAGLVEGNYTGVTASTSSGLAVAGQNVPRSKMSDARWGIWYNSGDQNGNTTMYAVDYGNRFDFIGPQGAGTSPLTPEEAWNIDKKVDDGRPAYGKVIARGWNDTCASADDGSSAKDDLNASYLLSSLDKACGLQFIQMF